MLRKVTVNTFTRMFHKIINNFLYLNKLLLAFKKVITPLCSFCKSKDKTPIHLFFGCLVAQTFWKQLSSLSKHKLIFPKLTRQSAIFSFLEPSIYIYNSRYSKSVNISFLKSKIKKLGDIEEKQSKNYKFRKIKNSAENRTL